MKWGGVIVLRSYYENGINSWIFIQTTKVRVLQLGRVDYIGEDIRFWSVKRVRIMKVL